MLNATAGVEGNCSPHCIICTLATDLVKRFSVKFRSLCVSKTSDEVIVTNAAVRVQLQVNSPASSVVSCFSCITVEQSL